MTDPTRARCYAILDRSASDVGRNWTSPAFHSVYAYRLTEGAGVTREDAESIVADWLRETFNGPACSRVATN